MTRTIRKLGVAVTGFLLATALVSPSAAHADPVLVVLSPTLPSPVAIGQTITVTPGTYLGAAPTGVYGWRRCETGSTTSCVALPGVVGSSYTVASADSNQQLIATESVTDGTTSTEVDTNAALVASGPPIADAGNGYYDIHVSGGRYWFTTGADNPVGAGRNVLFPQATSYETVRASGRTYITGAGYTPSSATVLGWPTTAALGTTGVRLTFAENASATDPNAFVLQVDLNVTGSGTSSAVTVLSTVTNRALTAMSFQIRYLWDTQIGIDDGPTFQALAPDGAVLTREADFTAPPFQNYRIASNDGPSPFFVYGTISAPSALTPTTPAEVKYVCWRSAVSGSSAADPQDGNGYDYTVDPAVVPASSDPSCATDSDIIGGDSAVLLYWDLGVLTPDGSNSVSASLYATPPAAVATLNWVTPAPITYGTALSAAQLSATAAPPEALGRISYAEQTGTTSVSVNAGTTLDAGDHTLVATLTPADGYTAATTTVTLHVDPSPTAVTLPTLPDRHLGDAPFAVSPTLTGAPTGATATLSSTTPATCSTSGATVTLVSSGRCTLSAAYPGDTNHRASGTTGSFQVLELLGQNIDFAPIPDQLVGARPVTLHATGGASGLPVTYSTSSTSVCAVSGTVVTIIDVGLCTVTAAQAGNANYTAAPNRSQTFAVTYGIAVGCNLGVAVKAGTPLPITVRVVTAAGATITKPLTLHADSLDGSEVRGIQPPGNYFIRVFHSYLFTLDTRGLSRGQHTLSVSIANDPRVHPIRFQIK